MTFFMWGKKPKFILSVSMKYVYLEKRIGDLDEWKTIFKIDTRK